MRIIDFTVETNGAPPPLWSSGWGKNVITKISAKDGSTIRFGRKHAHFFMTD